MPKKRTTVAKLPKKRSRRNKTLDIAALVDAIFAERVVLKEGSRARHVTCGRAIVHQLWAKSIGGSRKAQRLYMRYLRFFASQARNGGIELRFGPDMLTGEELERKWGRQQ